MKGGISSVVCPTRSAVPLLRVDDLPALRGRHDPDLRLVRVLRVVVDDDVLELVPREKLRHGPGARALARARIADQHHVSLLLRGLPDDLDGMLLADDLVHEPPGDLDLRRAAELELPDPLIDRM